MPLIVIKYYYGSRYIEIDRYDNQNTVLRRMNESISEAACRDISNIVSCTTGMRSSPEAFRHKMAPLVQSLCGKTISKANVKC
jgi:hypothetical protein